MLLKSLNLQEKANLPLALRSSRCREVWRPIPGYERWYEISNQGNVRTYYSNSGSISPSSVAKFKGQSYSPKYQYYCTYLSKNKRGRNFMIHILVAMAFKKNPFNLKFVNHKNGNKLDNRARNVEWCTKGQNQKHAYDSGLKRKLNGTLNGRCKLTEKDILEIFNMDANHYDLAAAYNVSRATISHIKDGRIWSSLTGKKRKK